MITEEYKKDLANKSSISNSIAYEFENACDNGDLEIVQYLLTHDEYKKRIDLFDDNTILGLCDTGQFEIIKYLLTSPELDKNIDIHVRNEMILVYACVEGDMDLIRYLLTSPELKEHANIKRLTDPIVIDHICKERKDEIFTYILHSPELKTHIDLYANNNEIVKNLYIKKYFEALAYLIFDYKMELKEDLEKELDSYPEMKKMFDLRKLNHNLNNDLPNKCEQTAKVKI